MRVTWPTQGKGNPPVYVQLAMHCCTYSSLTMTFCVYVAPVFMGKAIGVDVKTGDIKEDEKPFEQPIIVGRFTMLKFFRQARLVRCRLCCCL